MLQCKLSMTANKVAQQQFWTEHFWPLQELSLAKLSYSVTNPLNIAANLQF